MENKDSLGSDGEHSPSQLAGLPSRFLWKILYSDNSAGRTVKKRAGRDFRPCQQNFAELGRLKISSVATTCRSGQP